MVVVERRDLDVIDVLFVNLIGGRVSVAPSFGVPIDSAFGMLSVCGPRGQPWPTDAAAKLMCCEERMGVKLLLFVVLHGEWARSEHVRVDDVSTIEVGWEMWSEPAGCHACDKPAVWCVQLRVCVRWY